MINCEIFSFNQPRAGTTETDNFAQRDRKWTKTIIVIKFA